MSLKSLSLILPIAFLTGCFAAQAPQAVDTAPAEVIAYSKLQHWLGLQRGVEAMIEEEVIASLVRMGKPESLDALFYFGLLNQQLQTPSSWSQARDCFRQLQQEQNLTSEQRQLAKILLMYNQNRINWYQKQSQLLKQQAELRQELQTAEEDKLLLEQKIRALTELEAAISTRKEQ